MTRAHTVAGGKALVSTLKWWKQMIAPCWSGAFLVLTVNFCRMIKFFFGILVYSLNLV